MSEFLDNLKADLVSDEAKLGAEKQYVEAEISKFYDRGKTFWKTHFLTWDWVAFILGLIIGHLLRG